MASHPTTVSPTGKKLIQGNGGLRMINIIDEERSAFDIDECQWQNDGEVGSVCMISLVKSFKHFLWIDFNVRTELFLRAYN